MNGRKQAGKRLCATPSRRPRLNLALQGGGAHGAFTWGALDRAGRGSIRMQVLSLPDMVRQDQVEPSTKRTVSPMLFESLRRKGYAVCSEWLKENRAALGSHSSIDISVRYLAPYGQVKGSSHSEAAALA